MILFSNRIDRTKLFLTVMGSPKPDFSPSFISIELEISLILSPLL